MATKDLDRIAPDVVAAQSLIDRCYALRDRLLGNPAFQRLCASFPLTRSIAHSEARALFDLCGGFVYSQVLSACVRLNLFRRLAEGPRTVAELSRDLMLPAAATERLLLAAVSLRLVARRGQKRFGLGMLGAALNGNPAIEAMVLHHALLYRDLQDPLALLRGETGDTQLARYWPYSGVPRPAALSMDEVGNYSALMAASQALIADDILDAYPFGRHRQLLDIGGGEGAFIATAAERFPELGFMLFDLPAVTNRARERISTKLGQRLVIHEGSFLSDPLPLGADLVSLVRVVHDHEDATVLDLFRAIHRSLIRGGVLLVAEPMSGMRGAEPAGDAYFGMYLLAMGQGRPRRPAEIAEMMRQAGFTRVTARRTRRPMLVQVISGARA